MQSLPSEHTTNLASLDAHAAQLFSLDYLLVLSYLLGRLTHVALVAVQLHTGAIRQEHLEGQLWSSSSGRCRSCSYRHSSAAPAVPATWRQSESLTLNSHNTTASCTGIRISRTLMPTQCSCQLVIQLRRQRPDHLARSNWPKTSCDGGLVAMP
jgi:hypothetical protein